jgi:oligopeptide/dipeptide ABC transporter ATP-binding protein
MDLPIAAIVRSGAPRANTALPQTTKSAPAAASSPAFSRVTPPSAPTRISRWAVWARAILISHDLSVVRHMSDRVAVMYLGKIVELADRDALYETPKHPYTQGLLAAVPEVDGPLHGRRRKEGIAGEIPSPADPPSGCHFHPRCPHAMEICRVREPHLPDGGKDHVAACFLLSQEVPQRKAG